MRLLMSAFLTACLVCQPTLAAEIWTSESACLQRQLDLKKVEDSLTMTSLEMSRASLEEIPKAQLGGKIGDNRKKVETGLKEMRDILRELCDGLFP